MDEQTITVYRNPGANLTHFPSGGEDTYRTACKHYRLHKMEQHEMPVTHAAIWCTDCLMQMARSVRDGQPA